MKGKKWFIPILSMALLVLLSQNVGVTLCSFSDRETAAGNTLGAWTSTLWTQTTQADFNAGVLNDVDTSSVPGDVKTAAASDWYNSGWSYRKSNTIDHTKVGATLTDFPVLISLTSDAGLAAYAQDNGNDIVFTASNGVTKLDHEIEQFDGNTGKLVAWVRVPSVSSLSDTVIYLYYGNPSIGSQQNPAGVWNSNYKGVWHFNQAAGGSGAIKDSTSNANNGTDINSPTLGAAGKIGNAVSFDGINDYISVADSASLNLSADFTVELWFSPTQAFTANADYLQGLLDKGGYKLFLDKSDGKLKAAVADTSGVWLSPSSTISYNGAQEEITALAVYNGKLYAGQGTGTGDGDVLVFDGSTWTTSYDGAQETIESLAVYNGKLYAGQGWDTAGDGDVLVFDGTTWSISYNGSQKEIPALAVYNGKLYAGQGWDAGAGDVLVFDGSTWTTSYNGAQDAIYALAVYNGHLYAGQGQVTGDGDIYVLYAGSEVKSTTTSWSTSFHLLTATRSGTTFTIYLDGAQQAAVTVSTAVETNALNLLIGKLYGTRGTGVGEGLFKGIIDETRISSESMSAPWIATEYNNQNSPATFFSVGSEQGRCVSPGTLASQVLDTAVSGSRWDAICWVETLAASTNITLEVRASDTIFLKTDATPSWTAIGAFSPVSSGLTAGRYKQWRATLTTSNTVNTPILSEVRVYYH